MPREDEIVYDDVRTKNLIKLTKIFNLNIDIDKNYNGDKIMKN